MDLPDGEVGCTYCPSATPERAIYNCDVCGADVCSDCSSNNPADSNGVLCDPDPAARPDVRCMSAKGMNDNEPLKWQAEAEKQGRRFRVFCASMADWTDVEAPVGAVPRLWDLWRLTPNLDWLMLTKRPARIRLCLPPNWGRGYSNVWLGTTVEDVKHGLPRVDVLQDIPARVRFLSVEPQVEDLGNVGLDGIHWVIMGGESGPRARPYDPAWAWSLLNQCVSQGAATFVKQLGTVWARTHKARTPDGKLDTHGGNWDNWPEALRVREFPCVEADNSERQASLFPEAR